MTRKMPQKPERITRRNSSRVLTQPRYTDVGAIVKLENPYERLAELMGHLNASHFSSNNARALTPLVLNVMAEIVLRLEVAEAVAEAPTGKEVE